MNKKALVLAVGLAFATPTISVAKVLPSNLVGISLGEIQSKSYLNEPFKGLIPILFTSIQTSKNLKVSLAPSSVFNKIGAEKLPILNNLHFRIGIKNNTPVIFVESTQAIQMPFLNFVLEIKGPKGSIYQDYTTLLDPKGDILSTPSKRITYKHDFSKERLSLKTSASILPHKQIFINKKTHKVQSGDTLSQIAQALNSADISLNKMIKAIHKRNPRAFVNNNINRLKTGSILYIPTTEELKISTFKQAAKSAFNKTTTAAHKTEGENYTIKPGDNLSTITRNLGYKGISFTKMMSAIYIANPHAFSKNKINLLKVGKTLRIPTIEEVLPKATSKKENLKENITKKITSGSPKPELNPENNKEFLLSGFVIEKGDTLAKITTQIGHKGIPYEKMMRAIYLANPDAFEKNNITTLIEGSIIRLPSISEIKALDEQSPVQKNINKPIKSKEKINTPSTKKANSSLKNQSVKNTDVLNKLEKRVRELKRDLTKAHSSLSILELSLGDKEIIIKQQSQDLASLASTLEVLNSKNTAVTKTFTNNKKAKRGPSIQTVYSESPSIDTSTEMEIPSPNSTSNTNIIKSNIQNSLEENGYIPQEFNLALSTDIKNKIIEYSQYMSGKELFASILALLFGLALIRYRREIYAYTNISYDHPKYYPPFEEEKARELLKEKSITFHSALMDPPSDIHKENKPVFSNEHIKECEDLADELIGNLEIKTTIHSDNTDWSELDKACDDFIEEYKENNVLEITDVSNNPIEGARSEPEEMTFELFESLAEGVTKKSSATLPIEDNTSLIYGLGDEQVIDIDSFDEKKPIPFNDLSSLSDKLDLNKIQSR